MTAFKVGDRVRCYQNPPFNDSLKGAEGTVVEEYRCERMRNGSKGCLHVAFTGPIRGGPIIHFTLNADHEHELPEAYLENIEPPDPKVIEQTIQSLRKTHRLAEKGMHD